MESTPENVNFPRFEEEMLEFWQEENIFNLQNDLRKNAKEFSFYDGPPFANGLPHYGHMLTTTIKDAVLRYWIAKGYKVDRRFGWDCHGLPVEFEVEKKEGLKGRPDILKIGIERFNEICRESVVHYVNEWKTTVTRMGRWVDWDRQYRTMDCDFMESAWWVFKELYDKGLVYQGFKVVPYSPRTASVVSNFEANQNYKNVQDPALTVKFKIKDLEKTYALAWTTTPWTLPSNLALAVHPDLEYVKVFDFTHQETYILSSLRLENFYATANKDKSHYEIREEILGKDLVGLSYEPLFPFFKDEPAAFCIIPGDFVSTEDGTGIVHEAPAFGEVDFYACKSHGISPVDPVDENGCFTNKVPPFEGQFVKDADKEIIKELKTRGLVAKHDTIVHSYPFDERTDTPLIYKAVPSWYVAVEKIVDKLVQANQKINWTPSHLRDGRMGTWLKNARDWSISRNRFWGTPLPVWICPNSHTSVFGSIKDLEDKAKTKITDLHLHKLQSIEWDCEECSSTGIANKKKILGLVFDCWFESGSMPYSQLHYPFENQQRFEDIFPADFIGEGLDQTRGWFYTLMVLSVALFDRPAFKNVIVNGVILDEGGKKMSKRHRNYTPPLDLMNQHGADSIRLYMLNSALPRAEDLIFTDKGVIDTTRAMILPLWNAYSFLTTYAKADGWKPSEKDTSANIRPTHEMDRWIFSRLQKLNLSVSTSMESYTLYAIVPSLAEFIEDLTNWYIRLNRRRFWGEADTTQDTQAYSTLFCVLVEFTKILSSFAPFISEKIYRGLTSGLHNAPRSVHLCDFPEIQTHLIDETLEKTMERARLIVNLGRSLRQNHKLKVRQVLPSLTIISNDDGDEKIFKDQLSLLKSELNVKEIFYSRDEVKHLSLSLKPNLKRLGKRLGKGMSAFTAHLKTLTESDIANLFKSLERTGNVTLAGEDYTLDDFLIDRLPKDGKLLSTESAVSVLLDTQLTPELIAEGFSRECVNRVQNLRKDSGLHVSNRIKLEVYTPSSEVEKALQAFEEIIKKETLCVGITYLKSAENFSLRHRQSCEIEEHPCMIALEIHA